MKDCISSRRDRKNAVPFLIGILLLATGVRVAIGLLTTSSVFSKDDHFWGMGYEMGQIAASLALGDGFSWPDWSAHPKGPTAWMPPIYPFLIAAAFKTFGVFSDHAAIFLLVFQIICSVLTCFLLYLVGKRIFNAQAGLLAALFFAVYPASINFAVRQIWSTSFFSVCLLILILSLLKLRSLMNVTQAVRVGVLAGFTALVDPIILASYPFLILWLYVNSNRKSFDIGKVVAGVVVVFLLTISPWLIRNYIVFGQYVFIKSNFGNELFLGNNPYATGSYKAPRAFESLTDQERQSLKSADEPWRNRLLLQKAIAFISTHPLQFLKLTMTRFTQYWTFMMRPVEGWQESASIFIYCAVLVLGIISLFFGNAMTPDVQLAWLFIMTLPLPYYFAVVGLFRYRFPVETILVLLAALTMSQAFFKSRTHWSLWLKRPGAQRV